MRIGRFRLTTGVSYGVVSGEPGHETVMRVVGDPFDGIEVMGEPVALGEVEILAPVRPTKIPGFGRNYGPNPQGRTEEEEPSLFVKPPTTVIGTGVTVVLPPEAASAYYEAELAIVIGRECRNVRPADFSEVVYGYTCANDVSAIGLPPAAGNYPVKAKSFDTFCPLGPWVETDVDPTDLAFGCTINGEVRQSSRTSEMITGVADLVALTSAVMTLTPGDVILTGTPTGVQPLEAGDRMEVWIEHIGSITNPVARVVPSEGRI